MDASLAFEVVDIAEAEKPAKKSKHVPRFSGYVADVEMHDCVHCGWCEDPEHCVWGITCPKCKAGQSQLCREGSKLVSLHQERWNAVSDS